MWGKPCLALRARHAPRNIPTHVGKTVSNRAPSFKPSEHPHASGENRGKKGLFRPMGGTSPREWGKLQSRLIQHHSSRNIPTRVGKICRRRLPRGLVRNIPTRVGKTRFGSSRRPSAAEHPHASGENSNNRACGGHNRGTSPREWGKHRHGSDNGISQRNIPTRVGKTTSPSFSNSLITEHPHASGENSTLMLLALHVVGTSPREWGKQVRDAPRRETVRNIPTRVGKTF